MELSAKEMVAVEEVATREQGETQDLSLLQLALVGGGVGEVLFG